MRRPSLVIQDIITICWITCIYSVILFIINITKLIIITGCILFYLLQCCFYIIIIVLLLRNLFQKLYDLINLVRIQIYIILLSNIYYDIIDIIHILDIIFDNLYLRVIHNSSCIILSNLISQRKKRKWTLRKP